MATVNTARILFWHGWSEGWRELYCNTSGLHSTRTYTRGPPCTPANLPVPCRLSKRGVYGRVSLSTSVKHSKELVWCQRGEPVEEQSVSDKIHTLLCPLPFPCPSISQNQNGFALFQAEKDSSAAARLDQTLEEAGSAEETDAKKAATARFAGTSKVGFFSSIAFLLSYLMYGMLGSFGLRARLCRPWCRKQHKPRTSVYVRHVL